MFRIRKIHDNVSKGNREAIAQVQTILREQFPLATEHDIEKLSGQLNDPLSYGFRSVLIVGEDLHRRVQGFALMLHLTDLDFCYLEFISAAPGQTGRGIGGILYDQVREEAAAVCEGGLYFEVLPDEPHLNLHPELLDQNIARLKFYERYDARPVMNAHFDMPVNADYNTLLVLVHDSLGTDKPVPLTTMHDVVRAVLERKYGDHCDEKYIQTVLDMYQDDPVQLRAPRYSKRPSKKAALTLDKAPTIPLVINEGHDIHHVKDRGYVEAPVRLSSILKEIEPTGLFKRMPARSYSESVIKAVHDEDFVNYIRKACEKMPEGKSIYPVVFPLRNKTRPPKELAIRAGYYCMDTFTPINRNAYKAARGAVNCAMTAADAVLAGEPIAYALVRPPGHHAEKRAVGGFCYFNSAAVAAENLSDFGRVAILDVDFHHGNGTQDIFYDRADVLTVSIHGHPNDAYPFFSGFEDETGEGEGEGFNVNYPLPEKTSPEQYLKTLNKALDRIRAFRPEYFVLSLGLDTARNDPTGTWMLGADDFTRNGIAIGGLNLPTLVVQEGGYYNRTLGVNARHFFTGFVEGWQKARRKPAQR